jgi:very-short-patch-repair endonuclease
VLDADVASLAAVRLGGRLGCLSAMGSYGHWDGVDERDVHVSLAVNAARLRTNRALRPMKDRETRSREVGQATRTADPTLLTPDRYRRTVVLHWRDLRVGARPEESAWRVELPTALAQVARCASRRDIRAAFESVVHAGALSLRRSQRILDVSLPKHAERMVLSGRSGSGAESHFVEELLAQGLRFEQQVEFPGIGRVDFGVEGRLVVEIDGYEYHSGVDEFERDRERDADLLALGYPTVRIPARIILRRPDRAAEMLRGAMLAMAVAA